MNAVPTIITQPVDAIANPGAGAVFNVAATGTPAPSYQWRKNGANISGATAATLILANVQTPDAGAYSVLASNVAGSITSNNATLVVDGAPRIAIQPVNTIADQDRSLSLAVRATGVPAPSYQWRKDGATITGATSPTLTFSRAHSLDGGSYSVAISNAAGTMVSNAAALSIVPPGSGASQTAASPTYTPGGTVAVTTTINFTGAAAGLAWRTNLPPGWSYASGSGNQGSVTPVINSTNVLEWSWAGNPVGAVTFSYVLNVPAQASGAVQILGEATLRQNTGQTRIIASPLKIGDGALLALSPGLSTPSSSAAAVVLHSADWDRNQAIGLLELTRVIELYNTRNGTTRTGHYLVQDGTEDGFNPDPSLAGSTIVTLTRYHSADSSREGKLSLLELTRVIELYNHRSGIYRTGGYHAQDGTEDGFTAGSAPNSPPIIVGNPGGSVAELGQIAKFTLIVQANPAPTSYQWQRKTAGASSFVDLSDDATYNGATTITLQVNSVTAAMSGDQFQCVVGNGINPAAVSSPATLTVMLLPEITSSLAANGTYGVAFNYAIQATNSPTSFSADGLPTGLSLNTATGVISGSPTVAGGPFYVTLRAAKGGDGGPPATLVLTIALTPVATFANQIVYNQGLLEVKPSMLNAVFRDPITSAVLSGTVTYSAVRVNTGETINPFAPQDVPMGQPGYFAMTAFYGRLLVTAKYHANDTYNEKTVTAIFENVDNMGPTVPGNFRRVVIGPTSFSVAWEPSADLPVGQGGPLPTYELTLNGGSPVAVPSGLTHTFSGVAANAAHTVGLRAKDYFGNLSDPVTITVNTPAAGTDPTHETRWFDVNGDGLPDEVVGGDSGVFYYFAAETQQTTVTQIDWSVEFTLTPMFYHDGFALFHWSWVPELDYDTYVINSVRPKFIFNTDPDYEYTICRVLSPTQLARLFPPTSTLPGEWSPPGFWPEDAYNAAPFVLARISKPLGFVSVAGITTGTLGISKGTGGIIDILLPSGGAIINVSDLANKVIKAGPQIVWEVWDAVTNIQIGGGVTIGGILNTANIGITTSGEWLLGFRFGELPMAWIKLRAPHPILQPITLDGSNTTNLSSLSPPFNPSGMEVGAQRSFQVKFGIFEGVNDSDVTWTATSGVSLVARNTGKTVTVAGVTPGVATLTATIAGFGGPKPTVTTHVFGPSVPPPFNKNVVKLFVYVVRDNNGSSAAIDAAGVADRIKYANNVFKQAGVEFEMQGSVQFIDNAPYLDIDDSDNYLEGRTLAARNSGTGGLEIYFVRDIVDAAGLNIPAGYGTQSGILVEGGSPMKTLAHEIGHACGWPDIYTSKGSVSLSGKVQQAWLPDDWNNAPDAKYYNSISQATLVERLLMHGHGSGPGDNSIVISRGAIHGVPLTGAAIMLDVGLATMNRDPKNP